MALSASVISELATVVDDAQRNASEIVKLTDDRPEMDLADAYAVQAELLRRWQGEGRRLTGYKGGLTSKAKMVQMGLDTPVFGLLMGDTCVPDGDVVDMKRLIHPKVEAEIAFVTSRELSGDVSIDEVLAATEFVLPAIEVIDSRYKDFKFDIQSVVADNTSAARYVVGGSPRRPAGWSCGGASSASRSCRPTRRCSPTIAMRPTTSRCRGWPGGSRQPASRSL